MTAGLWCLSELSPKRPAPGQARRGAGVGPADAARCRRADAGERVRSLVTPFFTSHPVRDYQSAAAADTAAYAAFFRGMLARGVYPPPSQFEAWFISAAHTDKDIDRTLKAAREALSETAHRRTGE